PWGLVSLFGTVNEKSMGMDCGWFPSFVEAYLDSTASTELPIWQVFKRDNGDSNPEVAITAESDWDSTWEIVYEYRKIDKNAVYNCHHNVNYRKSKI
ncbi:MAG: hypothetical protein HN341_14575, partial [Verrucomicrobia bacterium]|nr:hypothetical protein [Verrucomicrobiota bacterium]